MDGRDGLAVRGPPARPFDGAQDERPSCPRDGNHEGLPLRGRDE